MNTSALTPAATPRKLRTRPRTPKPTLAPRPVASVAESPERRTDWFIILLYAVFAVGCLVIAGIYYAILYGQPG